MKLLLFIYGWVLYNNSFAVILLQSDALLPNLPMIITAVCSGIAVILGAIGVFLTVLTKYKVAEAKLEAMEAVKISNENKAALAEVKTKVDGMVSKLLEAKDETAKVISAAQNLKDLEKAAFNEGKLSAIQNPPAKEEAKVIKQVVEQQVVEKQDVLKTGTPPKK